MSNLVSTTWLADNLSAANLVVLDCTWHLPNLNRNAASEFEAAHIPGAQFFDLDLHSDQGNALPHMLPGPMQFAAMAESFAIRPDSHVVVYDSYGLFSAARVWWMFKGFGHVHVSVLNGGLKKWVAEGRGSAAGQIIGRDKTSYPTPPKNNYTVNDGTVAENLAQVVDARSPTRFRGEEAEPRPGVQPGHIPGAHNVHYASLLAADGTMKTTAELRKEFANAHVDLAKPIITSCGSGVTAAILTLALTELGVEGYKLYDGSWAQWGASGREIELG